MAAAGLGHEGKDPDPMDPWWCYRATKGQWGRRDLRGPPRRPGGLGVLVGQPAADRLAVLVEQRRRQVLSPSGLPAAGLEPQRRPGQPDRAERRMVHLDQQPLRPGLLPGVDLIEVTNLARRDPEF